MHPNRNVLLVEDEPLIAMVERAVLQTEGYLVRHVVSGEEAVALMREPNDIDLVLMDIDLGARMSGTEAAQMIVDACEVPLVFLSAHTEPEVVQKTEGITSYGYIVKNSGNTVLLASIRMAFRLFEEKQAVRRHDNLLQGVFNSIQDGISVLSTDLRIQHVNHTMQRWYPQPEGQIGKHCHEVYLQSNQACLNCPSVRALNSGTVERAVLPGRRATAPEWMEVYADPMTDPRSGETTGVVEFVRDITVLKQQQRELKRRAAELELMLTVGETLSNVYDTQRIMQILADNSVRLARMDTAAIYLVEGRELVLSATYPPLPTEYPEVLRRGTPTEHPHIELTVREQRPVLVADFAAADLTPAERRVCELRRLRSAIFMPLVGREGVAGVMIIATQDEPQEFDHDQVAHCRIIATQAALALENAKLHASLTTSERKLAAAAEMARIGHWELDVARGVFTFSDSFYRLFRTTAQEQGGYQMPLREYARRFVHPEDAHMVAEESQRAIEASDSDNLACIEHRVIFADGAVGFIEVRYAVIKDATGRTVKTYGVNQDITARKASEEAVRTRLREQEALLKEVHHRIKNNFGTISGLLKLQQEESAHNGTREALNEAAHRVDSMRQVYETLLSADQYGSVSIREYMERLVGSLRETFAPTIRNAIQAEVADIRLQVKAITALGMIANELLTNAAKYAFQTGIVGEISLSVRHHGSTVELAVSDTGVGFPAALAPNAPGGFGLMLVRLLAEQLQGSFQIGTLTESTGTRAVVTIPDAWVC